MTIFDRMKDYEKICDYKLVPRLPIIVRVDGRAFHTFCRNMERPYDERMSRCMIETTKYLVEETHAVIGYTQSDEINLILYNENPQAQPFFDGRVQKLASVIASLATVKFAQEYLHQFCQYRHPSFDCRVFNVPSKTEAVNVLVWREMDAVRNSISMAAQSVYSHKELFEKKTNEMQEMLFQKGINWNDYPAFFKRGTYVKRIPYESTNKYFMYSYVGDPKIQLPNTNIVTRHHVEEIDCPRLLSIQNRVDFVFSGEEPILKESPCGVSK